MIVFSDIGQAVSVDVLDILAKRRTPVESLEIDVVGVRVDTIPRRFKHITLNFKIAGSSARCCASEQRISSYTRDPRPDGLKRKSSISRSLRFLAYANTSPSP